MTKVRTTINPREVIDVDDAELTDLARQGIIKSKEGDKGWKPEDAADDADTKKEG